MNVKTMRSIQVQVIHFVGKKENSTYTEGLYWFYEGGSFIIDIHDFYIKEEVVQNSTYSMSDYVSIYSSYIVSANGEKFNPYQTITANSLCTFDFDNIKDDFVFYYTRIVVILLFPLVLKKS